MLRRGDDRVRLSQSEIPVYRDERERERVRECGREQASGRRTTKTTGCVNLCTQRVACDSNTGRFLPPANSPPPTSSSSPLSNSHERPAEDLRKDREHCKSQASLPACISTVVPGCESEGREKSARKRWKASQSEKEEEEEGARKQGIEKEKKEREFPSKLGTSHLHNIQGRPIPHSFDPRLLSRDETREAN